MSNTNINMGYVDNTSHDKNIGPVVPAAKRGMVVRRNELILGRHRLSLQEMRLLLWLISEIKSGDEDFKRYRISVSEFSKVVGIEGGNIYTTIPEITRRLMQRVVELNDRDEKVLRQRHLVSAANYRYGEGFVEVELHPDMRPYLLNIKEHFTAVDLEVAVRFKSTYSLRLYEILKAEQFKGATTSFAVEELRKLLGVEIDQYARFTNFRARVLGPATTEITNRSDLAVNYSAQRQGKTVDKIVFNVRNHGGMVGYPAGSRKDKLFRGLRTSGMPTGEAMKAIADWADDDVGRIEYHLKMCKDKKVPLAWLRAGLKEDYRPNRSLLAEITEMKLNAAAGRETYKPLSAGFEGDLREGLERLYTDTQ
jgi:hypothetical protein